MSAAVLIPTDGGRLHLPDVTLVAASSIALPATIRAMQESLRHVRFGAAILFSDRLPDMPLPESIDWQPIARLDSRRAYSELFLRGLSRHIATSHILCVQWDGYVLDATRWLPPFLDYDYIGAPWPHFDDGLTVGNGGFSMRSRKLLEACRDIDLAPGENEDVAICRTHRRYLEREHGIRFAPEDQARRFGYERHAARGDEFGFHGVFNLARIVPARSFCRILAEIEPHVIAGSEHRELLIWSLRHRHWSLAWQVMLRMLRRTNFLGRPYR